MKQEPTKVLITYPAKRCAALYCGDKIKGSPEDSWCWKVGDKLFHSTCYPELQE